VSDYSLIIPIPNTQNIENDQMAIRIYYRLFCEMYRYELDLLEELHEVNREAFILRLVEQEALLVSE
jgi:hypothetical protein